MNITLTGTKVKLANRTLAFEGNNGVDDIIVTTPLLFCVLNNLPSIDRYLSPTFNTFMFKHPHYLHSF